MLMMLLNNIRADPFVAADSEQTEERSQLVHCYTVAGKNAEKIYQQIYNEQHVA